LDKIRNGEIKDGKTIIGVMMAATFCTLQLQNLP